MIQENKGNVLNQFTNFNKVDEFPKSLLISGRHCMLGIEGSRKSYLVLDMMIKLSNEERGIPTICSFNTIEQQYEKYETAISIAESLGWKEGKIRNKIRLLPSTREITRNLFKTKMPWFSEIMRTKSKGNERLDLLSIHQKTWKVTKPCATHPKHFGYNYQQDNMNNNLLTACNFIMGRLKQTKNHVKQHTLAIVSKNGDAPDKNKIQEFMDDCIHSLNEPWRHPEIKVKQKNLLEAITNKINRTGKYLDADKNFEVCIFTKDDINNTKDILKENNILINYIRNSFDDDSESIILFTQHEKFTWEFNPVMFPTTRIDWAINNFRIFQDETPITKFSTLNMETLGNHSLSRAFYKNKENLTAHEYNMLKMLDPDTLIKVKTKIEQNPNAHHIIPLQGTIDLQVTADADFLQAQPQFRMKKTRHNPVFTNYKNMLITTTEILDATYLNMLGYKIWDQNYKTDKYWEEWKPEKDDVEIFEINNNTVNTTKKNTKEMAKFIAKLKITDPDSLLIGKKDWGCHSTIDAIKGSNKVYLDDSIKEICIFLNPMNPNEIINYFAELYELIPDDEIPDDLHYWTMVQRRIDYINQACGRVLGPRKAYRLSYGMDKIKVKLYYSSTDAVTKEAISRCRYLHDNTQFSEIFSF